MSFPKYQFLVDSQPEQWTATNPPDYFGLRLKWQYATGLETDLDMEMWKTVNVSFKPACEFLDLIGEEHADFYPPDEWLSEPTSDQRKDFLPLQMTSHQISDGAGPRLFNGRSWPTRGDFYDRHRELSYANDAGFRGFSRTNAPDGTPPPRLTFGRPFFEHLDTLVQYWDTSLDEYILPSPTKMDTSGSIQARLDGQDEPRKKTKLSEEDLPSLAGRVESEQIPEPTMPKIIPALRQSRSRRIFGKQKANSPPPPPGKYRGWRVDTGKNMPSSARDMIVKAIVDLAVWPFCMHVDQAERSIPKLCIKSLKIIVPLSKRVWRDPSTREEARRGVVCGPALGISARHTMGFVDNKFGSDLDLLRELGAVLLIAQERNREGRNESAPGKDKWWNEKPRWAGFPYQVPGEYQKDLNSEESNERRRENRYATGLRKRKDTLPQDMTLRQRAIHLYKINAPSAPNWDGKARYTRIGSVPGASYDEVCVFTK